ncbi:MAG: hypothetical protein DID90_2727553608 [Candidatus Nitrotoga sp. LAW]|nr:MAG: hypothetical protein DID90_2727553608 [Candidatus Nitrotoga sp. LAW]
MFLFDLVWLFFNKICPMLQPKRLHVYLLYVLISIFCTSCAVVAVTDAAVTVVATTVKVSAAVVGTTVDVAAAGVKAVAGSSDKK